MIASKREFTIGAVLMAGFTAVQDVGGPNDAVFGLLPGRFWAWPYFWGLGANKGSAEVTVRELPPDNPGSCQP